MKLWALELAVGKQKLFLQERESDVLGTQMSSQPR